MLNPRQVGKLFSDVEELVYDEMLHTVIPKAMFFVPGKYIEGEYKANEAYLNDLIDDIMLVVETHGQEMILHYFEMKDEGKDEEHIVKQLEEEYVDKMYSQFGRLGIVATEEASKVFVYRLMVEMPYIYLEHTQGSDFDQEYEDCMTYYELLDAYVHNFIYEDGEDDFE